MLAVWNVLCGRKHAHGILSCLGIGVPMDLDLVYVTAVVVAAAGGDDMIFHMHDDHMLLCGCCCS